MQLDDVHGGHGKACACRNLASVEAKRECTRRNEASVDDVKREGQVTGATQIGADSDLNCLSFCSHTCSIDHASDVTLQADVVQVGLGCSHLTA